MCGQVYAMRAALKSALLPCPLLQALAGEGVLLLEEAYGHKYPYDWRTKKPTIFRATDQVGQRAWRKAAWQGFG